MITSDKLCIAISEKNISKVIEILNSVELAEIRMDLIDIKKDDIKVVFNHSTKKIATFRTGHYDDNYRVDMLQEAIKCGATYIDMDITDAFIPLMKDFAHQNSCKVIISDHNYSETPSFKDLCKIVEKCYEAGADIAKIACKCNSMADGSKILSLYQYYQPLVAVGMGEFGKITRIAAPYLGSLFTFVSFDEKSTTAPGQLTYSTMQRITELIK